MMIEIIVGILVALFSFALGVILGKRAQNNKAGCHEEKNEFRPIGANETIKELQGIIDSVSGNPVAVDDEIRKWLSGK